jgi:hypothetical protein
MARHQHIAPDPYRLHAHIPRLPRWQRRHSLSVDV